MSKIEDFFNALAIGWDTDINPKTCETIKLILKRARLNLNDKILDVGAGTGVLVPFFPSELRKNLIAIDFSVKMAEVYKKKFPKQKIIIDNYETPKIFKPRSFNKIIIYDAFPHFRKPENVFNNSFYYLKKNGKLIIAHSMSREKLKKHHAGSSAVKDDVLIPDNELKKLYENAGFTNIEIENGKYFYSSGNK